MAKGRYLVFIDDDTVLDPLWLKSIVKTFQRDPKIAGVSGPAYISDRYRCNRDLFRFVWIKRIYDFIFLEGNGHLPGHFTRWGAWTTGAADAGCTYDGPVHFLEACNMAFRADIFKSIGGFDTAYKGVGDWSEPDLAFRVRKAGHELWFSRDARLEHQPSKSGAFTKRKKDSPNRLANYWLFSKRWIRPCWQHTIYKLFLRAYYAYKTFK